MTPKSKSKTLFLPSRGFVPAVVALALGWSSTEAGAVLADAQAALNAKLAVFKADINNTKTYTLINAPAADLAFAVGDVIENPFGVVQNFTPAEVVTAALLGNSRKDREKIIGLIVTRAINTSAGFNLDGTPKQPDSTKLQAILDAGIAASSSTTGKLGAASAALALATSPTDGAAIGTKFFASVATIDTDKEIIAATSSIIKAIGNSTSQVQGFAGIAVGKAANKETFTLGLIAAAAKNPAAAGEVAGAYAATLGTSALVLDFAKKALYSTKYKAAGADVAADTAERFVALRATELPATPNPYAAFVTAALTGTPPPKTTLTAAVRGAVTGGALQAEINAGTTEVSADIINAGLTGVTLPKDVLAFATAAAGRGGEGAGVSGTGAGQLAIALIGKVTTASDATKLGQALIKGIALTFPSAGKDVAKTIASKAVFSDLASLSKLAVALGSTGATADAAGAAVAGVAAQSPANAVGITAAALKSLSKAAPGIAAAVIAGQVGSPAKQTFATSLVTAIPSRASAIAVGASISDPANTATLTAAIIQAPVAGSAGGTLRKAAASISGAVALAVDIEQASFLAEKMGSIVGAANGITLSQVSGIASAIAKAVVNKPTTYAANDTKRFSNRIDELGEIAGSLIKQVVGKASATAAEAKKLAAETSTITSITNSILKALSKKLAVNAGNNKADLKDGIDQIVGSVLKAISTSALAANLKTGLIGVAGTPSNLQKALLKTVGKTFASIVTGAFTTIQNGGGAAYQTSPFIDAETPSKNG